MSVQPTLHPRQTRLAEPNTQYLNDTPGTGRHHPQNQRRGIGLDNGHLDRNPSTMEKDWFSTSRPWFEEGNREGEVGEWWVRLLV